MTDDPQAEQPETIEGAKLIDGVWQDLDGNPLSTADLQRLREQQAHKREQQRRDREKAARERAKAKEDAGE
jgi:hypothetical protein